MMRQCAVLLFSSLVASCGGSRAELKILDQTLRDHASTLRWGDLEQTLAYADPAVLEKTPINKLELERWRQWRIAGVRTQPYALIDETHAQQLVQIDLVNVNTQVARDVVHRQAWRYDAEKKRWLLSNPLPSLDVR